MEMLKKMLGTLLLLVLFCPTVSVQAEINQEVELFFATPPRAFNGFRSFYGDPNQPELLPDDSRFGSQKLVPGDRTEIGLGFTGSNEPLGVELDHSAMYVEQLRPNAIYGYLVSFEDGENVYTDLYTSPATPPDEEHDPLWLYYSDHKAYSYYRWPNGFRDWLDIGVVAPDQFWLSAIGRANLGMSEFQVDASTWELGDSEEFAIENVLTGKTTTVTVTKAVVLREQPSGIELPQATAIPVEEPAPSTTDGDGSDASSANTSVELPPGVVGTIYAYSSTGQEPGNLDWDSTVITAVTADGKRLSGTAQDPWYDSLQTDALEYAKITRLWDYATQSWQSFVPVRYEWEALAGDKALFAVWDAEGQPLTEEWSPELVAAKFVLYLSAIE